MNKYLELVSEFHKVFKSPILDKPTIISESRFQLRYDLIFEELEELSSAYIDQNKVEILDALCDLVFVTMGTVLELGYSNVFDEAFQRVYDSNMSKSCETEQDAIDTCQYYAEYKNTTARYEKSGDKYLVFREKDDKTLKSVKYSPVDLIDLAV